MENDYKEVFFDLYCKSCEFKDYPVEAEPCCYCIEEPVNVNSHKPVKYKKKEEK